MSTKINKLIQDRYSPRAFSLQKVEDEKIKLLIEAARWAASAFNEQPSRVIVGKKGQENYDLIFSTLMPKNQLWNKNVPLLLMTMVKLTNSRNGKPNKYAQHDLGLAIGNLCLQAMDMGLYTHQMAGFDKPLAKELFDIPQDYIPMTVIAVGYREDIDILDTDTKKREQTPRTRREHDQLIFLGNWDKMK